MLIRHIVAATLITFTASCPSRASDNQERGASPESGLSIQALGVDRIEVAPPPKAAPYALVTKDVFIVRAPDKDVTKLKAKKLASDQPFIWFAHGNDDIYETRKDLIQTAVRLDQPVDTLAGAYSKEVHSIKATMVQLRSCENERASRRNSVAGMRRSAASVAGTQMPEDMCGTLKAEITSLQRHANLTRKLLEAATLERDRGMAVLEKHILSDAKES